MDDDYDYWTEAERAKPAAAAPALIVETIEGVEPLDAQFGVAEPLTVPTVLQDALFGQPEPTEAELAAHGGDLAPVLPLQTYAILDAAKVQGLTEMLEASGLQHRCLFKGDAYDEMKDAAPWIVRLEDRNRFTRDLFTKSDAPWHLWDTKPGIYIRSSGTLEDLWQHFRYFIKIRDEVGNWAYFRFYEDWVMCSYLESYQYQPGKLIGLLQTRQGDWVEFVTHKKRISASADLKAGSYSRSPAIIDASLRAGFSQVRWQQFKHRLFNVLRKDELVSIDITKAQVDRVADAARQRGYRSEQAIYNVTRAWLLLKDGPIGLREIEKQVDPGGRLTAAERAKHLLRAAIAQTGKAIGEPNA